MQNTHKGVLCSVLILNGIAVASASPQFTIVPIDISHWVAKSTTVGSTPTVTQETDGIKFTAGSAYRTNAILMYKTFLSFSDATIRYKFMAHGGGYFMDANVGICQDNSDSSAITCIAGSRYTTGNPWDSYQIPEDTWMYSTLTIRPDRTFTIILCSDNYCDVSGQTPLDTRTVTITDDSAWQKISNSNIAVSIGDNRNWMTTQWMKIGEVLYIQRGIVGGSVINTGLQTVICKNVTTGQSVTIKRLKGAASWDCTNAGLQAKTGDVIKGTYTGTVR